MIWYDGAKTIAQKNTFKIPLKKLKVQAKNPPPPLITFLKVGPFSSPFV
jgi:hypothetical protein